MEINEANIIIAEYMEFSELIEYFKLKNKPQKDSSLSLEVLRFIELHTLYNGRRLYSESLDALVPVWDKLKQENDVDTIEMDLGHNDYRVTLCSEHIGHPYIKDRGSNLNETAAIATAIAIRLLNEI